MNDWLQETASVFFRTHPIFDRQETPTPKHWTELKYRLRLIRAAMFNQPIAHRLIIGGPGPTLDYQPTILGPVIGHCDITSRGNHTGIEFAGGLRWPIVYRCHLKRADSALEAIIKLGRSEPGDHADATRRGYITGLKEAAEIARTEVAS